MIAKTPTARIARALLELASGATREAVAARLGVSTNAVAQALERWRDWRPVELPQPQQRACLRCREVFASEGAANRICGRCKHTERWSGSEPVEHAYIRGGR
jgi:uncharacterized paraquat-inducible protein A